MRYKLYEDKKDRIKSSNRKVKMVVERRKAPGLSIVISPTY